MRPLRRCFIAIFMNKNCLFSQTLAFRNPLKCPFSTALKTYSDDARVFFASVKIDVKGKSIRSKGSRWWKGSAPRRLASSAVKGGVSIPEARAASFGSKVRVSFPRGPRGPCLYRALSLALQSAPHRDPEPAGLPGDGARFPRAAYCFLGSRCAPRESQDQRTSKALPSPQKSVRP